MLLLERKNYLVQGPCEDRWESEEREREEKTIHSGDQRRGGGAFGVEGTGSEEALSTPAPRG